MRLVIEDEAGTRSIVPFAGDAIVVGRGVDVTFRLADRDVSRRHARFARQNGAVFVEDLGSLTGTRVNGERITGRRKLRQGDLVQIGEYDLAIVGEGDAVVPDAPPPLPAPAPSPADAAAVTPRVAPAVVPAAPVPPRPVRSDRTVRIALFAGVVALALGVAAGWAVGVATAPTPPAVTRP